MQNEALAILQKALFYDNDDRQRKISFHEPLTTDVREIPLRTPEENVELFYQRQDFALFQAKEQQRYDKMMMKRIQQMVTEAMKDELEAAYARNATPEEIDAMMPQTTEEIFELLGGMPTMEMMKPPSASMHQEQMAKLEATVNEDDNPGNDETDDKNLGGNSQHSNDSVDDQASSSSSNSEENVKREPINTLNPSRETIDEDPLDALCKDDKETEEVDVVKQRKFHLGNDDPHEADIYNQIKKNDAVNDVLGTSFSSDVHVEDLVPLSPKRSPVRSPIGRPMVPMVNLDEDLFLESSP